MFTASMT